MASPRPLSLPGPAEEKPAPPPSTETVPKLPTDAERSPDGEMHSASVKWPPAKDDPSKPFKNLR